jgi:hypothetical protein
MRRHHPQTRRRLTPAQKRKVFAWWRDQCLKKPRKRHGQFDVRDIFFGVQLSLALFEKNPDALSNEWAAPAVTALEFLGQTLRTLEIYPKVRSGISDEEKTRCDALAERLDWSVAMIRQELVSILHGRAFLTRNDDLLLDLLHAEIGNGSNAVDMLRRIQLNFSHVDGLPDGQLDGENTMASFAWDTYQRVALLDQLVDDFPQYLRPVARQMHAWPILRHPHASGDARFQSIAERLELGADYPLDTRKTARFRPDSPMVRYLDDLIPRMNLLRENCRRHRTSEDRDIVHWWQMNLSREQEDHQPNEATLRVLRRLRELPALIKVTAVEWTRKAVVPLVLATDAEGTGPYAERALEQIRLQRDVKSRAIFQSRLESKIGKTLRSLARPG